MQCPTCSRPMDPGPSTSDYPDCNTWSCRQCGRTEPDMLSARLTTAAVDAVPYPEITDDQIDRLLITSVYQGAHDVVLTCLAALDGSEKHRAECCRVIAAAKEMED